MNDESTPKGAHESATTDSSIAAGTDFTAEDRHAAFVAGYEQGKAERIEDEIEDRARALLHSWATESRNMATRYASRVGPAWSALIAECGGRDD
jgi:hypothetical protein